MKEIAKKIISMLMVLCMVLSLGPAALAAGVDVSNGVNVGGEYPAFILETVTGVSPGDRLDYFAVRYMDTGKIPRVQFIFPNTDLNRGYVAAAEGGSAKSLPKKLKDSYGLQFSQASPSYDQVKALQPYHRDMFLFVPEYPVKEILSVELLGRWVDPDESTTNYVKNEWSCQGLRVYGVDTVYGLETYGGVSNQYFIDFEGDLLAEMAEDKFTFQWADGSDVLFRVGKDEKSGYSLKTGKTPYSTRGQGDTIFKMDISDNSGAGIEAFVTPFKSDNKKLSKMPLDEVLTLELNYYDSFGDEFYLNLPVVTGSLEYAKGKGAISDDSLLSGYMQQGESIVFGGVLPDFKEIRTCKLRYGKNAAKISAGLSDTGTKTRPELIDVNTKKVDTLSINGFSVYSGADAEVLYDYNGCSLDVTVEGCPMFYYTATTTKGLSLKHDSVGAGGTLKESDAQPLTLSIYNNSKLSPQEPVDRYLLVISTDDVDIAGTKDDLECQLYYKSVDGTALSTDYVNIRTSMQSYFGYWPGKDGDMAYHIGASNGGQMFVLMQIKDVDFFTGLSVRLASGGSDEWQGKQIQLYKLDGPLALGKRRVIWKDIKDSSGELISDREVVREYEGIDISPPPFEDGLKMLVQSTVTMTNTFETKSTVVKGEDVDWSGLRYSMSYAEAIQGLGFRKIRASYTVNVQVAGDVVTESENGDCGSRNQFYFQLVFEQGKSGYILANQQLSADGFRSGRMETFRVYTNQDYGKLTAIQIIPENPNDPDAVFDKLKIAYIEVKKDSEEELVPTWKVAINDWISIDYRDTGVQDTVRGQQGRAESEIARTFLTTSSGYSVNLLFALTTGTYTETRLDGALRATIYYYDIFGEYKSVDIDVIEAMYHYAGVAPTNAGITVTDVGENAGAWDPKHEYLRVDQSFMLRENHTDRFVVSMSDVREITSVKFHIMSRTSGYWNITALNVYRITSGGVMVVNSQNEYQNTAKTKLLCSNSFDQGYTVFYPANEAVQSVTIEMDGNPIDVDLSNGWVSALDYVPKSRDDQINIYAFVSEDVASAMVKAGINTLKSAVQYSVSVAQTTGSDGSEGEVQGSYCQTSALLMMDPVKQNMFYAKGIRTSGIVGVTQMALRSTSLTPLYMPIDHAVIEQVRSGVVIRTYYLDFGSRDAEQDSCIAEPTEVSSTSVEKQTVSLFFGDDTERLALVNKKNDFVVSISYKSTNDPAGTEYTSPNVFLSDLGLENIEPGEVVELDFHQSYVREITAVTVTAVGTLSDHVDIVMAGAGTYLQASDGSWTNTGWYSFANPVKGIGLSPRRLILTASTLNEQEGGEGTVTPITLKFHTTEDAVSGGAAVPIRMKLAYTSRDGSPQEKEFEDVVRYRSSGSFQAGEDAVVKLMATNVNALRYVELEPYDRSKPYDSASWTISTFEVEFLSDGQLRRIQRTPNCAVIEGTGLKINLSDIVLSVDTSTFSVRSGSNSYHTIRSNAGEGSISILVEPEQVVELRPTIMGSLDSFACNCERIVGDAAAPALVCLSEVNGTVVFRPLENTSGTPDNYRITIYSLEIPSIYVTVNLTVESSEPPQETEITEPTEEETPALPPEDEENKDEEEPEEEKPTGGD